jgi:anti-sigma factor RsiW
MTELSDDLLVAFVDRQLEQKQTSALKRVLAQDDVIARRVGTLKDAHRRLEAAFEAILAGEEADAVAQPVPRAPGLFIARETLLKGGIAAAGIVIAAGLLLAGYGWPLAAPEFAARPAAMETVGSLPADWRKEVARAQSLLSRTSLEIGADSQSNPDFIAFQLGEAIGAKLTPPDLTAQGFRFTRAQILVFGGEPLAQLLYLGPSGAPLALYAKKGGNDAAQQTVRHDAITGLAWSQGGVDYVLAGESDEASLQRLAEVVRSD